MKPRLSTHIALAVVLSFGAIGCTRCMASIGEARKASRAQEISNDDGKTKVYEPYNHVVVEKIELKEPVDYETWKEQNNLNQVGIPEGYELLKQQELRDDNDRVKAYENLIANAKRVEVQVVKNPETGEEEYYYKVIDEELENADEFSVEDGKTLRK